METQRAFCGRSGGRKWGAGVAVVVVFLLVVTPSTAGAGTLVNSPFTLTAYDGWTDVYDYSQTPYRGGLPGWGILLDENALCEASDGFPKRGGVADGGAAEGDGQYKPYIMVNSAATPSAYTVKATMSSYDDDGLGIVFGYQDNNNYFRVGARGSATGTYGFPGGLSLDKVVNGTITQIATNTDYSWYRSDNTPFCLRAIVNGSAYQIDAWDPASGDPIMPIFSGSDADLGTLAAGKYGVHSWGNQDVGSTAPAWGTQLHSMEVTSATLNKTHTFNSAAAWPLGLKSITMTNAEGGTTLVESNATGVGSWRMAFGFRGNSNDCVIVENSNAYQWGTVTAPNVDFISPAIIVSQAGAEAMENYQMQVRIACDDNEGPGVLVRVNQDDTDPTQVSFYRVNFASQSMGTNEDRAPQGLSIQKCVAGGTGNNPTWTELLREDQAGTPFRYKNYVDQSPTLPFDLKVIVTNNADDTATKIRVEVISDPDGTATSYAWEVTDSTSPLLTGTVGLANWGAEHYSSDGTTKVGNNSWGTVYSGYGGDRLAPLVVEPVLIPEIPGDANRDGSVNEEDAAFLAQNWGDGPGAAWGDGDFNKDGYVNAADASILAANWGYVWTGGEGAAAVPEPGVMVLLLGALAAMAAARRRKK